MPQTSQQYTKEDIRNVAIIAHVDHGKTTLIDAFLKQSKLFRENEEEMDKKQLMDTNDLEREKGITIKAKTTSIPYKEYKINIVDTPGHADFGGEVEQTLNLAEGCLLLVDAQEGVMPQTKFVLKKALEMNLKPIVVINKIDKKLADPQMALEKVQDLFLDLANDSSQLDFPVFYAIGREGKAFKELPNKSVEELKKVEANVSPILDEIINTVPHPEGDEDGPFQMQVSAVDFNVHYGRYSIGKIIRGKVHPGDSITIVNSDKPEEKRSERIKKVFIKSGLKYQETPEASVGEIIAIVGIENSTIGDTFCVRGDEELATFLDSIQRICRCFTCFACDEETLFSQESYNAHWRIA